MSLLKMDFHSHVLRFSILGLIFSLQVLAAQQTKPLELPGNATLSKLSFHYDVFCEELRKPLQKLQRQYEKGLNDLIAEATKAGDLEKVLAVKNELAGYEEGKTTPASAGFPELQKLQEIYAEASTARIAVEIEKKAPLTASYRAKLEAMQISLTKQSKLTEAIKVKKILEALAQEDLQAKRQMAEQKVASNPSGSGSSKNDLPSGKLHIYWKKKKGEYEMVTLSEEIQKLNFVSCEASRGSWSAISDKGRIFGTWKSKYLAEQKDVKKAWNGFGLMMVEYRNGKKEVVRDRRDEFRRGLKRALEDCIDVAPGRHPVVLNKDYSASIFWSKNWVKSPPNIPLDELKPIRKVCTITRNVDDSYGAIAIGNNGNILVWNQEGVISLPEEFQTNIAHVGAGYGGVYIVKPNGEILRIEVNGGIQKKYQLSDLGTDFSNGGFASFTYKNTLGIYKAEVCPTELTEKFESIDQSKLVDFSIYHQGGDTDMLI